MKNTIIMSAFAIATILTITSCSNSGPKKGLQIRVNEAKVWLRSEGLTGNEVTYGTAQWALWEDVPEYGNAYFYKAQYTLNLSQPQSYYEVFCWIEGSNYTMDITSSEWSNALATADKTGTVKL